ncbi:MAG: thioesterase family protein [Bacteroidota bacterium]
MARVKLELPGTLPFSCKLRVRITDLNYAGHLGNDKVLSLIHEARAQYFVHYGYTELSAEGIGFIMSDCVIVFKSEGHFNQELTGEVGAGDFARASLDLYYRLRDAASGKIVAEAKTGMVAYDYERAKVVSIPLALKARLGNALHPETETNA